MYFNFENEFLNTELILMYTIHFSDVLNSSKTVQKYSPHSRYDIIILPQRLCREKPQKWNLNQLLYQPQLFHILYRSFNFFFYITFFSFLYHSKLCSEKRDTIASTANSDSSVHFLHKRKYLSIQRRHRVRFEGVETLRSEKLAGYL